MLRYSLVLAVFCLTILMVADAALGCTDCDGDGHAWPADCNDADGASYPGATEACDGFDNDCDGLVDNDPPCDTTCDAPAELGDDQRLTDEIAVSDASSITWTGNRFAVAWTDRRFGVVDQIWFARLSSTGAKLGPEISITSSSDYSIQPSLVWTGSEYGLLWSRLGQLYFARLDDTGTKIGLDVPITTLGSPAQSPSLVWTGAEYGVAWQDGRDGNDEIYFVRLDETGARIGSDVRVTSNSGQSTAPRLVSAGGEYGVAWNDDRDGNDEIYFARLDAMGSKLITDLRVTDDTAVSETPDLVWTGSEYGITWRDRRDGNGEIYFALLSAAGVQIGSDVRVTDFTGNSALPRLQWTGSEYGIVWRDRRDGNTEIYFTHLDSMGLKIGTDLRVTNANGESTSPDLSWTGTAFGLGWTDSRDGNQEIYFSRVNCSCAPDMDGDGFSVCDGDCDDGNDAIYPGAAQICDGFNNDCDDSSWPVLPPDEVDGDGDGLSACDGDCLDSNDQVYPGAPQICDSQNNDCDHPSWPALTGTNERDDDGDGLSECEGDCADDNAAIHPAAAQICDGFNNDCLDPTWPTVQTDELDHDGDGYFTCSGECDDTSDQIYPGAPQICDGLNNDCDDADWPALTGTDEVEDWDGDGYTGCQDDCDVLNAAINTDATEICDGRDNNCDGITDDLPGCDNSCDMAGSSLPMVLVTNQRGQFKYPSMVSIGSGFAMAWSGEAHYRNDEIYLSLLDEAGQKSGDDQRITDADWVSTDPVLVWTGQQFGLAWSDSRESGGLLRKHEIYFNILDTTGQKAGPDIRLTMDESHDHARVPDLVWTGADYGLVWQDARASRDNIYFTRLSPTGEKLVPDMPLSSFPAPGRDPSITWTGTQYAVAWHDWRHGNPEIYLALIDAQGDQTQELRITETSTSSVDPKIVWTGSELGLFWTEGPNGSQQLYFVRLDGFGARLSADLALTQYPQTSINHHVVWTGEEFGVSRVEGEAIHFLRIDPSGTLLAAEFPVTNLIGEFTGAAWNGNLYGVFGHTPWGGLSDELLFTQIGCACVDLDGDGAAGSICSDCDDSDPDIYWGAPQICDGVNNDCSHPSWPGLTGTNEDDDDMDGLTTCAGDCDNAQATVYPGAPEICDGFNNNCNDPEWPSLASVPIETSTCLIDLTVDINGDMTWESSTPYTPWNVYRGDLGDLRHTNFREGPGLWTQLPGSNAIAAQDCGVSLAEHTDTPDLIPGEVAFYLITGYTGSVESGLGPWLDLGYWWDWGANEQSIEPRINDNSCP